MAHRSIILFLATFLAASAMASAQCTRPAGGPPSISLQLLRVRGEFPVGVPVRVTVVMTNQSDRDFSIWRDNDKDVQYGVDVKDAGGKSPKDTKFGFYHNGHVDLSKLDIGQIDARYLKGSGACVNFRPGATFRDTINVSKLYDLNRPGKYSVQVQTGDPSSGNSVKSNTIMVTVVQLPQGEQPAIDLYINIPNNVVKAGSPITLYLVVTNTSDHLIQYDPSLDRLHIELLNHQGGLVPPTERGQKTLAYRGYENKAFSYQIKPDGSVRGAEIPLNTIYDLSRPGEYTIQVSRFDDTSKTWVKSNTITLTVTP